MDYLSVLINAVVVALMAMYVYENDRKMGEMSTRQNQTELTVDMKVSTLEKELDKLKILVESKEEAKTIQDLIKDMKQLISTKAGTDKLAEIEKQQTLGTDKLAEIEKQQKVGIDKLAEIEKQQTVGRDKLTELEKQQQIGRDKLAEIEKQQKVGRDKLAEIEKQQKVGTDKLAEIEKQQKVGKDELAEVEKQQKLGTNKLAEIEKQQKLVKDKLAEVEKQQKDKGVTYIRWGKTLCDGPKTETIYSGQVGGGHYSHSGASVNYICLPNNPDVAQPLQSHDNYAYMYGAEYEMFHYNKPHGIRSGIGQHDVACAACLAKGKISSILIPGRKTCYNGWTKEYEGILMAGYHGHAAASEYACVDRDAEAIAGGSNNEDGKLFYPVKTACGSLKCPPYLHHTEVLCVVCSK